MKINLKIAVLLCVVAVIFTSLYFLAEGETSIPRRSLGEFPTAIEGWSMVKAYPIDDKTMEVLKVDDFIMRDYRDGANTVVNLYIGYFKHQRQGKAIHSPRQCMPGAGWTPLISGPAEIALAQDERRIQVQKMLMGKGSDRQWCFFWYHGRGRIHGSEYLNKLYLVLDGATQKRTDGALVRIVVNAGANPNESLKTAERFIRVVFPGLDAYIPG